MKRIGILCACLLVASQATAATIVTWEGSGEVTRSSPSFDRQAPPVGTPLAVTLSFAPSQAVPTPNAPPGAPGCSTVDVNASFTLGGFTYAAGPFPVGFTHSQLLGTNCTSASDFTEFSLGSLGNPSGAPYNLSGGVLVISYRDLLVRDSFPDSPTIAGLASVFFTPPAGGDSISFSGNVGLHAVDQPTPVPEPGTISLLAIGLAAVVRRARR
jgi:hypothetical protein